VNIDEDTINNDELIMGHLIFNLEFLDFSLTSLALIALSKFQNDIINQYSNSPETHDVIKLKNVERDELININQNDLDFYAKSYAYSNPEFKNQREMVYDVSMIEHLLKDDLFSKIVRINVDKEEIEKYNFSDEKMGIGNKIEIIGEILGTDSKLSGDSKKAWKALQKKCKEGNQYEQRGVYKDLRKIIFAVSNEIINDGEKTIADIIQITPNLKVDRLFDNIKLKELYTLFDRLEFDLKDIIMEDNISPVYKAQIPETDQIFTSIKRRFRRLDFRYMKKMVKVFGKVVLRTMESFTDNCAQMGIGDMISYSDAGELYTKMAGSNRYKRICDKLNDIEICKLEFIYKWMSETMMNEQEENNE
jgi:hypothetical protein